MHELQNLVEPLLRLCREAGELICSHYHSPGTTDFEAKSDESPLTRADIDSHALLQAGLRNLSPEVPLLSEESCPTEVEERLSWHRYWLVDPLDGTKEFLAGTGEFTVNIALIEDHRPCLGMLYLPLDRRAYVGIPGSGGYCYRVSGDRGWSRAPLETRRLTEGTALTVLASRRHGGRRLGACLEWLERHWGPVERLNSGSALKFCQLADGEGDFYPRFSPCCEWDTAAGQAVLEAAGGALVGLDGQPLRYNTGESLYSPNFYAFGDPGHALWESLLESSD